MKTPLLETAVRSLDDLLLRAALALPGDDVKVKVDTSWVEQNLSTLVPVIAIGTIAAVVLGIVMSLRNTEMSGLQKAEYKKLIVSLLRREVKGTSLDKIAKELKLGTTDTRKLLLWLQEDNIVEEVKEKKGLTWRLKGLITN